MEDWRHFYLFLSLRSLDSAIILIHDMAHSSPLGSYTDTWLVKGPGCVVSCWVMVWWGLWSLWEKMLKAQFWVLPFATCLLHPCSPTPLPGPLHHSPLLTHMNPRAAANSSPIHSPLYSCVTLVPSTTLLFPPTWAPELPRRKKTQATGLFKLPAPINPRK